MKGISLTQPWATLVALGEKRIETRGWNTSYRGQIAIAAAKKFPDEAVRLCTREPFRTALGVGYIHTGKIVAVATLRECFRFDPSTEGKIRSRSTAGTLPRFEADFGDYADGRYGFVFKSLWRLQEPIPCKGALGLWDVPAEVEHAIGSQQLVQVA